MFYLVLGVPLERIPELASLVLPVMRKFGVTHDYSTFVPLPSGVVVDEHGNASPDLIQGLYFPAFDAPRKSGQLEALASELSDVTGIPCSCVDSSVIAAYGGHVV
jgi:hypothetical protein